MGVGCVCVCVWCVDAQCLSCRFCSLCFSKLTVCFPFATDFIISPFGVGAVFHQVLHCTSY